MDQPNNGRNRRKHHTKTHTKVLKPKVGQQEPHADMDEATIAPDSTAPLNSECGAVIECEGGYSGLCILESNGQFGESR